MQTFKSTPGPKISKKTTRLSHSIRSPNTRDSSPVFFSISGPSGILTLLWFFLSILQVCGPSDAFINEKKKGVGGNFSSLPSTSQLGSVFIIANVVCKQALLFYNASVSSRGLVWYRHFPHPHKCF